MPTAVFSFKQLEDGSLLIHTVVSPTKDRADHHLKGHADVCPAYGPAFRSNQTIEFAREVTYIPSFDGDELEEWLNGLLSDADDVEDEAIDVEPV